MVGVALETTTAWLGSEQLVDAVALLSSPLYVAVHLYVPGAVGEYGSVATLVAAAGYCTTGVIKGARHIGSLGANSLKVSVAPSTGLTRPLTVALSKMVPPSLTPADGVPATPGVAL